MVAKPSPPLHHHYTDHAVIIWEEREGGFNSLATPERSADGFLDTHHHQQTGGAASSSSSMEGGDRLSAASTTTASRWVSKATLSDARRSVSDVEFAPRHLGLRLASASADGIVRIYEAIDAMNLNHWKLEAEIEENTEEEAGKGDGHGGQGNNYHSAGGSENSSFNENMGASCLSWCTGRFEPATLVVGYSSGRVSVIRYDDDKRSWLEMIHLPGHATPRGVPRGVLDVSWAPNVGRSFHLIATCGKDNQLKVHRIQRGNRGGGSSSGDANGVSGSGSGSGLIYEGRTEVLDESQATWRCQWNVTGTVLASSGDGGMVKLWKNDFQGRWKCVSQIVGDTTVMASASSAVRDQ
jgi:nucleoporin SEH1